MGSRWRKPNPGVLAWFQESERELLHISVATLGEIRRGIRRLRIHDPRQAIELDRWLEHLRLQDSEHFQPIDETVALQWGPLGIQQPISVADGLIAATTLAHHLVPVTCNSSDFDPLPSVPTDIPWPLIVGAG